MSEKASPINLLHQTEEFLDGVFYWSWNEIVTCLKNCDPFFSYEKSSGLIQKLLCSLLAKIAQNSDVSLLSFSSSSSSSSPETAPSLNSPVICNGSTSRKAWAWWFQDLTVLSPKIIENFLSNVGLATSSPCSRRFYPILSPIQ
ncbi:UNVERIFIED_CONTAM: BTB/POZ domain-containing protein [Sesamum latifolium]|uniref:BTB/POZ domain-containing protein n=1 Tax=Sesamum latifolium TaxID=2727402 RepID=A0AAW2XZH9_9LAMI